jgi:hypothetical protein
MDATLSPPHKRGPAQHDRASASVIVCSIQIAALSGADKLAMRARLQLGHNPLLRGAAAPEALHGYGDGLDPAQLCHGDLVQAVHLGRWTIRWANLAPVEVVEWAENPGSLLPASGI